MVSIGRALFAPSSLPCAIKAGKSHGANSPSSTDRYRYAVVVIVVVVVVKCMNQNEYIHLMFFIVSTSS